MTSVIISRTPLRVSFAGGGTDIKEFYGLETGRVMSTAISQYVYVTVKPHSELFDDPIRVNYKVSEEVQTVDEIQNNLARECLRFLEIEPPIYINMVGDVPASTGLGGSSAIAVGLLNALHAVRGERVSAGQLAEEACHIEIDVLNEPIGKQDQYAAAYGGMNTYSFREGGTVSVRPLNLDESVRRELFGSLMLFWTGSFREARIVLTEQQQNAERGREGLRKMRDQVVELQELMKPGKFDLEALGGILDRGWKFKQALATGISSAHIDSLYQRALAAGASGGRLCGAGGGGFLLLVVRPELQGQVRAALSDLTELPFGNEVHGSQVVTPFGQ
jgi:D-glycero-alpha-D-manno-heptose-7-phosphate kinase